MVERLLGRGGMGAAYLARAPGGPPVVLKLLAPEVAEDPRLRARFEREAAALRRLPRHPSLVSIEDVADAAGEPCLVMGYVEGPTLADEICRQGRLAPDVAARLAQQVADGLQAAHAQGVIHRDVKPANVIVGPGGRATLVDFGVAKDLRRSALTVPGQLLGTAAYLAPELWSGEDVDARADLFSLGATLYHALVGVPPFEGDLGELADQAEAGDYPPPREAFAEIPEELERVVVRLLMPDRTWRHASAGACARDLEGVLAGRPAATPCLVAPDGRRHALLPALRATLGRDPACDLVLDDASVSRRHAQVAREAGGFSLTDLGSSGGTFVGDERVTAPRLLLDGDRVRLGGLELRFDAGDPPPG